MDARAVDAPRLSVVFENWLSLRSLEGLKRWTLQEEVLQFVAAMIQYFTCSLVSIKVPREGPVDMATFNTRQAPVFLTAFAATSVVLVIANYIDRRPGGSGWIGPDLVDLATLGLIVLAATVKRRWVQILAPASILALMAGYLVALMPSS